MRFKSKAVAKYVVDRLHLLALPLLLLGFFEYLCRGSIIATLVWMKNEPLLYLLNYLLILALLLLFIALFGRTWTGYSGLAAVLSLIGFVSGVKTSILGVPLMPWDVVLSKETQSVAPYLSGILNIKLLGVTVVFMLVSIGLLKFTPKFQMKFHWSERILFVAFMYVIGSSMYLSKPFDLRDRAHVADISWNQAENYQMNGFLATTAINIKLIFIPTPANYNEAAMKTLVNNIPRRTNIDQKIKPNIIVVLSEAFWDPTLLPKVTFDHDPVPNLHQLMKTYSSGWMLSPQFGGGTANVEFEVLTGNSMRFMPNGSTPYIQYVDHGIDSLPSILRRQGYTTTSINPFFNWFYNSNNVYKDFGFSKFISSEFFAQNFKGLYIADSEVTKNIIAQTQRSAGPDFIFANTMENHYPYYNGKFKHNAFKVSGNVTNQTKNLLATYATGASDADLMLKSLVDYYAKSKEPTIVVFFGDHKPALGSNYSVYYDTGYFKPNDPDILPKMFDVPVVVWNNYLPPHKDNLDISPSFLGPYVLNLAQQEGTPYEDYLYALSQKMPIIPPSHYYEGFNINPADLEPYELLQYDMMFGNQYQLSLEKTTPVIDPNFLLGYGKMEINSVAQLAQNSASVVISGDNLVQMSTAYINGKAMPTKWIKNGELQATLPKKLKPGKAAFEVKVIDSEKIVVSESNQVNVVVS